MLLAVFVLPLLCAYILYRSQVQTLTLPLVQHGTLLRPAVPASDLRFVQGQRIRALSQFAGHWLMLYFTPDVCTQPCLTSLQALHQIQVALHKEQTRVKRLLLTGRTAASVGLNLQQRDPELTQGVVADGMLARLQQLAERQRPYILLVDPLSNVLMRYDTTVAARDILKDMRRLLRISKIG